MGRGCLFVLFSFFLITIKTQAAEVCNSEWRMSAYQSGNQIHLKMAENFSEGPACDLVVQSFEYLEAIQTLVLKVEPTKFCPLDSIEKRKAYFSWHLPYSLRSKGRLKVLVNQQVQGSLVLDQQQTRFEGECR